MYRQPQAGVSLVELLTTVLIVSSLLAISTFAARTYSHRQQIQGAEDAMVSQLRQLQERALAVSNPSVFGAWFRTGDNSDWGPVEFVPDDPTTPVDETDCLRRGERGFDSGPFDSGDIEIEGVGFSDGPNINPDPMSLPITLADFCLDRLAIPALGSEVVEVAFFFPKGDATAGTFTISHTRVDDSRTVEVLPITGRVRVVES